MLFLSLFRLAHEFVGSAKRGSGLDAYKTPPHPQSFKYFMPKGSKVFTPVGMFTKVPSSKSLNSVVEESHTR